MFSTVFYLLILFYEGIFLKSSTDYNSEIIQVNKSITEHQYKKALANALELKKSRIFNNSETESLIAVLELKNRELIKSEKDQMPLTNNSIDNAILKSHCLAKYGQSYKGLKDLKETIIQKGNLDTLIRAYELYAFYFPQNKLKKQAKSAQMISQTQKINTQEALSLLNLMKKKQKNLIY